MLDTTVTHLHANFSVLVLTLVVTVTNASPLWHLLCVILMLQPL